MASTPASAEDGQDAPRRARDAILQAASDKRPIGRRSARDPPVPRQASREPTADQSSAASPLSSIVFDIKNRNINHAAMS